MRKLIIASLFVLALCTSTLLSFGVSDSTLFRTGFEFQDNAVSFNDSIFAKSGNITPFTGKEKPECSLSKEVVNSGNVSLRYSGHGNGSSYCTFMVFDVNIPISSSTKMSYWIYPIQDDGRYVSIDFVLNDGSTLRDSDATDKKGNKMHPNNGHGGDIPLNAWTEIRSDIGVWLSGKSIVKIMVNYDKTSDASDFMGYIDDILITNNNLPITQFKNGFEALDSKASPDSILSNQNMVDGASCLVVNEAPLSGTSALAYSGETADNNSAYCKFHVLDVDIPVSSETILSYWIYPEQHNGRFVAVDFITKKGNTLKDCGATDQDGISMHPNAGHGGQIALKTWNQIVSNIGLWLDGDTIQKILINYDQGVNTGHFSGKIDDILIVDGVLPASDSTLFYTSLEPNDKQPNFLDSVFYSQNITHFTWASKPECSPRQENPHAGDGALMFSGQSKATSGSYCVFKVFEVNIPISSTSRLSYWLNPENDNSRYVAIDCITKTGNTLRDCGSLDQNGISMHPNAGHGGRIPLNEYSKIECEIGDWLNGDTIKYILVNFDSKLKGDFRGFIDDILLTTSRKADTKVTGITLTTGEIAEINEVGGSILINATVTPFNASVKEIIWKISDPKIATINNAGTVTAIKNGVVTVTATAKDGSNVMASIDINISNQPISASSISLSLPSNITIDVAGASITVTGEIMPENASNKNIIWELNNTNIASIKSERNTCIITAITNGTVILTATSESNKEIKKQIVIFISNQRTSIGNEFERKILIYPNPVSNILNISNSFLIQKVKILATDGRILKEIAANNTKIEIDLSQLKPGVYFLQLTDENNINYKNTFIKK